MRYFFLGVKNAGDIISVYKKTGLPQTMKLTIQQIASWDTYRSNTQRQARASSASPHRGALPSARVYAALKRAAAARRSR